MADSDRLPPLLRQIQSNSHFLMLLLFAYWAGRRVHATPFPITHSLISPTIFFRPNQPQRSFPALAWHAMLAFAVAAGLLYISHSHCSTCNKPVSTGRQERLQAAAGLMGAGATEGGGKKERMVSERMCWERERFVLRTTAVPVPTVCRAGARACHRPATVLPCTRRLISACHVAPGFRPKTPGALLA